ncbi:hemopexin repeat-containing protein [Antarctobacter sp.]|uniref:hemopexin repeat-containing protein n=1 Tax=Antarctobacter sp. TaxID=1872577 RepID=UPI002B26CCC1|nr:hemopexin repeat-containing protein [Antarctobacter sp.]
MRPAGIWQAGCRALTLCALLTIGAGGAAQAEDYVRYDMSADRADAGYPRPMDGSTWPGVWPQGIDAAVNWGNGKAYFFSGSQYVRYDIAADRADPGYPKSIDRNTWPGVWPTGVDAVINWGNGKAYFFKENMYIRYDIAADRADPGYPQYVDDTGWPGLAALGPIDAAINGSNGSAYFFGKGGGYLRYDIAADRADQGYPRGIDGTSWPGLGFDAVGAAMRGTGSSAYFFGFGAPVVVHPVPPCPPGKVKGAGGCAPVVQSGSGEDLPICANALYGICEREAYDACQSIPPTRSGPSWFDVKFAECTRKNACQ